MIWGSLPGLLNRVEISSAYTSLTSTRVVRSGFVGYFEGHEVEPPHPVCDMKSGGEWEGVVEEIDNETPEIRDFMEKKSQRQQY